MNREGRTRSLIVSLILLVPVVVIGGYRLHALDYDLSFMIPERVYDVTLAQTFTGHGGRVKLRTFLPANDDRQTVLSETNLPSDLDFNTVVDGYNRLGVWSSPGLSGSRVLTYKFRVRLEAVNVSLSPDFRLGEVGMGTEARYIEPTAVVQSADPEIAALSRSLVPENGSLLEYIRATFDHVQGLGFRPFKGTTDALTALRLGEASCNGRGRLFVALMRAQGIPARLVGGLVLAGGKKKTSHQWTQVRVGGTWIPMDPTNDHFASIPHNYLTLYLGDEVLFRHTADIGFSHLYTISSRMVPGQEVDQNRQVLGLWAVFSKLGIPLDLLKIVIMIPLGAVVVVIFRNVFGFRTFGTFLPVLIAASARHTGLLWGLAGFVGILLVVSIVRRITGRLQLLHSPQLAILLTTVIGVMLVTAILADHLGVPALARVTLFPVAIMAITAERFTLMDVEEGLWVAWATLLRTLVVVTVAYLCINSLSLQVMMLAFPELLLAVVVIDLWLGRWMGMRLLEWVRFRSLLSSQPQGAKA